MEANAWLLNFGDGESAAVGRRELLHLVPQPVLLDVPRTPRHCSRVLIWQNHVVPVWDVLAWLRPGISTGSKAVAAVVGYQSRRRQMPQFGALLLAEAPHRIEVADAQSCEFARDRPLWSEIGCSCFRHEERSLAILDLPLMFSAALAKQ